MVIYSTIMWFPLYLVFFNGDESQIYQHNRALSGASEIRQRKKTPVKYGHLSHDGKDPH